MDARMLWTALITVALLPLSADARDTRHMFSVASALSSPAAKEKLSKRVRFYFGDQQHPAVEKSFGEWSTNKKTNASNKSDQEACEWVFLSAMLALQERALQLGANAVVNIRSNYKGRETRSATQYECGAGFLMAGVALKGTVVTLAR